MSFSPFRDRLAAALFAVFLAAAPVHVQAQPDVIHETYLEGYGLASGHQLAAGGDGAAYVAANFVGQGRDVVVARVESSGEVAWETTIGGSDHDWATALEVDPEGLVTVAGWTDSEVFPSTPDAYQPERVNFREGFVLKLSPDDGSVVYGTFLGGDHSDRVESIAFLSDGRMLLAGATTSSDFPVVNALQPTLANDPYQYSDGFVSLLSADGSSLLYSSHLGASRNDEAKFVVPLTDGRWAVAGNTGSFNFPVVGGAQASFGGGERDAFVAILSEDGAILDASTYLGGEEWEFLPAMGVGADGSFVLGGYTNSLTFPTADAFQDTLGGEPNECIANHNTGRNCYDGFIARLSPGLDQLRYSSYLGGTGDDYIRGLAIEQDGDVRLAGFAAAQDFPRTSGVETSALFLARFRADDSLGYVSSLLSQASQSGQGVAFSPADGSVYLVGSVGNPAEIVVTRLTDLFADAFESGDMGGWSGVVD